MNTATHKFISSLLDIETITHFARENFVESWKAAKRTWNKQFSPPTHLLMFAVKANSAVMLCLLVHKSEISFTFFSLSVSYQAAPNSLGSHLMQKIKLNEIPRLGAFAIDSKLIAICMSWGGEAYKKIASCGIMKHQNPLYESIKTDKHRSTEMWSDTKHKELTHFNSVWCGENEKKGSFLKQFILNVGDERARGLKREMLQQHHEWNSQKTYCKNCWSPATFHLENSVEGFNSSSFWDRRKIVPVFSDI